MNSAFAHHHPLRLRYRSPAPLWRGSCSLREAASGCAPDRAVTFFCFAKRKSPKKRRPDGGGSAVGRTSLRCSVFGASRRTRFVRCAHAAQTSVAKSEDEARCRARPQTPALLDATHGDPNTRFASLRIGSMRAGLAHRARCEASWDRESLRSKRPYCSWGPSEPSRSAGLCRGAQRLRPLTLGGCLNAAAAGRVASSARAAKTEQRRAVGPRPTGEGGRLSFGSFSLAKQRKGTALSGAHPDAASRSEQDSH